MYRVCVWGGVPYHVKFIKHSNEVACRDTASYTKVACRDTVSYTKCNSSTLNKTHFPAVRTAFAPRVHTALLFAALSDVIHARKVFARTSRQFFRPAFLVITNQKLAVVVFRYKYWPHRECETQLPVPFRVDRRLFLFIPPMLCGCRIWRRRVLGG
jgi:hypothetical protein